MGTSGAYGGSNSKNWKTAQDSVANLPSSQPASGDQIKQVAKQIAQALAKQNANRREPAGNTYSPESLLRGAGAFTGSGSSGGRTLSGANAARGLAVMGAGLAYGAGNQTALDELGCGLRLEEMRDLTARDRCKYILDKVLGEPGTPDEEILRRAAYDALKDLLTNDKQTPDEAVSAFMAQFVFQAALVELTSAKAAKRLKPEQIQQHEKSIKQWITKQVKFSGITDGTRLSVRSLMQRANEFRDRALALLRGVS